MEGFEVRRNFEGLPPLDALDIMRESARLLRRNSDLLSSVAAVLIAPLSVVVLTHILITRPLVQKLASYFEALGYADPIIKFLAPHNKYVYLKLAEFLLISILYLPFAITLSMLAKAAVVHTVACTYTGVKVTYSRIVRVVVPKVWLRLVVTYLSSCSIFLGSAIAAILCIGLVKGMFMAWPVASVAAIVAIAFVGLVCCVLFVYMKIVFNVSNVVVVMEECYGFAALVRSFVLVQGRKQAAVLSFLITSLCGGFIGYLFESRVTNTNEYTDDSLSPAWEGPLLVIMHTFIYLFDAIMTSVFYFTCTTSSRLDNFERTTDLEALVL